MDGQEDRGDTEEPPPLKPRGGTRIEQVWIYVRSGLSVAEWAAADGQHEALTWTVRAIAVLGDIAVTVWWAHRR